MAVKPVVLLKANVEDAALKVYKSFWSNFQEFFEAHLLLISDFTFDSRIFTCISGGVCLLPNDIWNVKNTEKYWVDIEYPGW